MEGGRGRKREGERGRGRKLEREGKGHQASSLPEFREGARLAVVSLHKPLDPVPLNPGASAGCIDEQRALRKGKRVRVSEHRQL
eukprot:122343-Rhodomonas_salina.1